MPAALSPDGGRPRLVVVVAHPDDETFGTGSVLLHAAAAGVETTVVCATRGEAGEITPGSGADPADLAAVRESELRRAAAVLGVSRVEVLDFRDSDMSGDADASTLVGADQDAVRDAVRALLDDVRPDVVVTLDAGDGHRDHAAIRDATRAAVDAAGLTSTRVYLHCLPTSIMDRWVEHMKRTDPSWAHLELGALGTPDEQVTTEIDTRRFLHQRVAAMAEHRSQRSPFEGLPQELFEAFLTREHLIRVRPAWPGGPVETDLVESATAPA
jgi:LmbE family N-acetylglucosaminyl deacetylase